MGDIYTVDLNEKEVNTLSDALLEVVQSTAHTRDALSDRGVRDALNNRVAELLALREKLDMLTALPF